jgi:hypothetical protein
MYPLSRHLRLRQLYLISMKTIHLPSSMLYLKRWLPIVGRYAAIRLFRAQKKFRLVNRKLQQQHRLRRDLPVSHHAPLALPSHHAPVVLVPVGRAAVAVVSLPKPPDRLAVAVCSGIFFAARDRQLSAITIWKLRRYRQSVG